MDSRAKQRLTGAIILVALFVLFVPELLKGPKKASDPAAPTEEGESRYSFNPDAPSTPANQSPVNEPAVTLPVPERATPGEAARPEAPATTPAPVPAPAPTTVPASTATPAPAAPSRPAPTAVPTQPRVEPAKPPPAATAGEARSFVVQLGSFSVRDNAESLVRDMKARGFAAFISPITTKGRELYRVRVGPTRDRASAEALAVQLKKLNQAGSIVPIP